MEFNIKKMQETLNKSKKLIEDFDKRNELYNKRKRIEQYKSKFSPAYLSGNKWYIDYLESDDYTINKQFTYEDKFFYLIGHTIMNYQKKNNIN